MPEQPGLGLQLTNPTICILLELGWPGVLLGSHHLRETEQPKPPFSMPCSSLPFSVSPQGVNQEDLSLCLLC